MVLAMMTVMMTGMMIAVMIMIGTEGPEAGVMKGGGLEVAHMNGGGLTVPDTVGPVEGEDAAEVVLHMIGPDK